MRRDLFKIAMLALLILSGSACVYSKVQVPLDKDVSETKMGTKMGKASAYSIAWLVSWGDASTHAAANAASIQTINHLDAEYTMFLFGLYAKRTTIAYGN
jgi:hypothetical protein